MFEDAGGKLRMIGYIVFALEVLGAIILFIKGCTMLREGGMLLMLYAAILAFAAWVSTVVILALAEAAEYAATAAVKSERVIERLDTYIAEQRKRENTAENTSDQIPAWRRIEMEKEATAKAEPK